MRCGLGKGVDWGFWLIGERAIRLEVWRVELAGVTFAL